MTADKSQTTKLGPAAQKIADGLNDVIEGRFRTTNAQQRGFDDFPSDEPNPYPEGTNEHVLWLNGWNIHFMLMKRRGESNV